MSSADAHRPSCYGIAAAFSFEGICPQCPAFIACERAVAQRIASLSHKLDLQDLAGKHAAFKGGLRAQSAPAARAQTTVVGVERSAARQLVALTPEQVAHLAKFPAKVARILRGLYERGAHVQVIERINAGQNPFRAYPYLYAAVQMLITRGSFSRAELVRVYQNALGWTYSSAVSYASIATSICRGLGIAEEHDGRLVFVPNLTRNNP